MGLKSDLIEHSRYTWDRLRGRLAGLGDEEMLWQAVPGAWTVRTLASGRVVVDWALAPQPDAPFTTIAWRLAHLIDVYGSARNARWLGVQTTTPPVNDGPWHVAPDVAGMLELLDTAGRYWHEALDLIDEDALLSPLGPMAGQYATSSLNLFVLHQLDEAIHHGAEVGILRDLYRWKVIEPEGRLDITADSLASEPAAVHRAADLGRWDVVCELVERGCAVTGEGRTALHQAAAIGDLPMVQLLVEHGAGLDALDPIWHSTPRGWAEVFARQDVADYLRDREAAG